MPPYGPLPPGLRDFFVRSADPSLRHAAAADAPPSAAAHAPEEVASSVSIFTRGATAEERAKWDAIMWAAEARWAALPIPPRCTAPNAYAAHRALTASRKRPRLR